MTTRIHRRLVLMRGAVACAVFCLFWAGSVRADRQSTDSASFGERAAFIEKAIAAIAQTDVAVLTRLRSGLLSHITTRCQGIKPRLVVRCIIEAASVLCPTSSSMSGASETRSGTSEVAKTIGHTLAPARCKAIVDIAATNFLGESSFVSAAERTRLVETADHFRVALDRELTRRYAQLALAMMAAVPFPLLAESPSSLAISIDGFCVGRARQATLSYQRCSAALVWFIAHADLPSGLKPHASQKQQGPP